VAELLEIQASDDPRTFKVSGELDISNADHLVETLVEPLRTGGDVLLDVSDLRFIDSSGVRALVQTAISLEGRGRLVLRRPQGPVLRVLDLMGLDKLGTLDIESPEVGESDRRPAPP
jgi:anti-anti-sigma factor